MSGTTGNTGTAGSTNDRKDDRDISGTATTSGSKNKMNSGGSGSKIYGSARKTTAGAGNNKGEMNYQDGIFMKKNKVMVRRDGKTSKVTGSIRLKDGSVVLSDGTITMPDGTTRKMSNGESYSMEGLNGTNSTGGNNNK